MKKLIDEPKIESILELKFPQIGKIRLHSAKLLVSQNDADNCFELEFLVKDIVENTNEIQEFLNEQFKAKTIPKFTKSYFDEDFLERKMAKYFKEENGFLQNKMKRDSYEVSYEDNLIVITFLGDANFCSYVQTGVIDSLEAFLHSSFIDDFSVRTRVDREVEKIIVQEERKALRAVSVTKLQEYIGVPEGDAPAFICDVENEYARAILCGKVSNIQEKIRKQPLEINKRKVNSKYFVFQLTDVSGSLSCLIFPSIKDTDKVKGLDGCEVVVCGRVKMGRMGEFQMMVKTVTKCEILTKNPPPSKLDKDAPLYYSNVFPTDIIVREQANLLDEMKEYDLSKLQGKTIVVFDLETTGLSPVHDRIVEIGAVKLVDGKFTEKFSTLVNPGVIMSEFNMKIHGITNEEVANCPTIEEVIVDFYKFCSGASLCGHNLIGFDLPFIRESAKRIEYDFFNETIDTLDLAVNYVKGQKSNKLSALCEFFGVVNEKAHRAYQDAIATGQVLIRILSEFPSSKI